MGWPASFQEKDKVTNMPGPMSAPNGAADTRKPRDPKNRIDTGKIALKKGRIKHIRVREFETTLKDHATREAK